MTTALIDGDLIAYINSASAEDAPEWVSFDRADKHLRHIIDYIKPTHYKVFISGGKNFRYEVNPLYKANRTAADPIHRRATEQFIINEWGGVKTDGYEADDALGCEQTDDTIICSLDKDLLMIPGKHYSWPIVRGGKILRDHILRDVSYEDGIKTFYKQALIGDTSDNIIGIAGLGPVKSANIIDVLETEEEMYRTVLGLYLEEAETEDEEIAAIKRFQMNADCLWIWRTLGVTYSIRRESTCQ